MPIGRYASLSIRLYHKFYIQLYMVSGFVPTANSTFRFNALHLKAHKQAADTPTVYPHPATAAAFRSMSAIASVGAEGKIIGFEFFALMNILRQAQDDKRKIFKCKIQKDFAFENQLNLSG